MPITIAIAYAVFINIVTFLMYGEDKRRARRHMWRIPESILFGLAIVGGSLGAAVAMNFFHHKTHHKSFAIGIPAIIVAQMALIMWLLLLRNMDF